MKNTEIIKIDAEHIDFEAINRCGEVIRKGGLVCFPTETVYGLGANALDAKAVPEIFKAKGRPNDNPLIVHIDDYSMLELCTSCGEEQMTRLKKLGDAYWPGPLTIIVDKDDGIPECVSCGLTTVGIRMPENKIARALITAAGVPIAAPSANLSGKPSPSEAKHVIEDLYGKVDIIIDGGPCRVGVESTVLDVTGEIPAILRPGAITLENVETVLGKGELCNWLKPLEKGEKPKSPGMKYTHYSPKADVVIYDGALDNVRKEIIKTAKALEAKGEIVGIMTTEDGLAQYNEFNIVLSIGKRDDPLSQTRALFGTLREFDEKGATKVLAEAMPYEGVGNAVMNRLYRAAGGQITDVL